MATIRKRGDKYQVQVRRQGVCAISKSFRMSKDAEAWARQTEIQADRHELPSDRKVLAQTTLAEFLGGSSVHVLVRGDMVRAGINYHFNLFR